MKIPTKFPVMYRPHAKHDDRYMYDGITGATPQEAIMEFYLAVEGLEEGAASDIVNYASTKRRTIIVDADFIPIKRHKVNYQG